MVDFSWVPGARACKEILDFLVKSRRRKKLHAKFWEQARIELWGWWVGSDPEGHGPFPQEFKKFLAEISPKLPPPDRRPTGSGEQWGDLTWERFGRKVTLRFCRTRQIVLIDIITVSIVESSAQVIDAVRVLTDS